LNKQRKKKNNRKKKRKERKRNINNEEKERKIIKSVFAAVHLRSVRAFFSIPFALIFTRDSMLRNARVLRFTVHSLPFIAILQAFI